MTSGGELVLYYSPISGPGRPVILVAKALSLKLNLIEIDLVVKKEQLDPEFVKLNPQHCVPTLVDDGFAIWESRAILMYLVNKYGKGSSLYPEDPQKRALVDQRLFFDMGTLYAAYAEYLYPQLFLGSPPNQSKWEKIGEALKLLTIFIGENNYVCGNDLTIADISLAINVEQLQVINYDLKQFDKVTQWFERVRENAVGFKELQSQGGLKNMKNLVDQILSGKMKL